MNKENKQSILIKPYTPAQLAKVYKVDRRTLHRWLKPFREFIGEMNGNYFSIEQVKIIFGKIALPFTTTVLKNFSKERKSKKVWASERNIGKYMKGFTSE